MNCPSDMPDHGKRFWKRYHDQVVQSDLDYINFELLCRNWGLLKELDPKGDSKQAILYMALQKMVLAQQKGFGLASKKAVEAPEESLADVLGKVMSAEDGSTAG